MVFRQMFQRFPNEESYANWAKEESSGKFPDSSYETFSGLGCICKFIIREFREMCLDV